MNLKKKCTRCGEEKTIDNFAKNKRRKEGYSDWCKDCVKQYKKDNPTVVKKAYENRKCVLMVFPKEAEKQKEAMKEWRKKNPDKIKFYNQVQKEKRQSKKSESFL